MKFLTEKRFSFVSAGLDRETFGVVHFSGTEALSSLYEFNITLITDKPDLDLDTVLRQPANFTIHRPNDQQVEFNGILSQFEQLHAFNDCIFYRAQLRPRLWWLTLTHHNQVCLNLPVVPSPQGAAKSSLVGRILIDGGLTPLDFAFRTQKPYPPQEYVCQYDESHYAFISRWLEREGLYYFFEQTVAGEQMVITDSLVSHVDLPQEGTLIYAPPSGLDGQHHDEVVKSLICRQKILPQKVLLRDYNYERPTLEVTGTAAVDPQGRGESYVYGDYFPTPEEGNRLAAIYAESLLCRKREFFGESTVPFMMPGYTFSLDKHYRHDFNHKYLVCEVQHEGNQTGYLVSGLQGALADMERTVSYRNTFVAIPAEVQFRAERMTAKPRISGTLHATVDAEGSGEYAELDDQGRYKVRLPFDINNEHGAGKASCFLRMAQPYAGPKRGMHFPLPKGTEVLLTYIGGDPDRPVIAAAVPNPETPSPSTARNQTESVIQTGGDNKIRIEDKKGSERIIMQSPTANSWMRIGAPNDPQTTIDESAGDGIRIHSENDLWLEAYQRYGEYRCGKNNDAPHKTTGNIPLTGDLVDHFNEDYVPTNILNRHTDQVEDWKTVVLPKSHVHVSSLDTVKTQEGNIYDFGGYWTYNLGNSYTETNIEQQAKLNVKEDYDLLNIGGPNYTQLIFPPLKDGADASLAGDWSGTAKQQKLWVSKKYGNSYDYVHGNNVAVATGSSLNITHGGRHVEVKYRGDGSLSYWSKSEAGVTDEKKWDKYGNLIAESTTDTNTGQAKESKWTLYDNTNQDDTVPNQSKRTLIVETSSNSHKATSTETIYDRNTGKFASYTDKKNNGGTLASFSFVMSAKATTDISLSISTAFSMSVAAKTNVELSAAASAKIGIGAALEFIMWWNPSGKLQLKNSKFEYHGIGSQLDKEEAVKADIKNLYLSKKLGWITNQNYEMKKNELTMRVNSIGLDSGIYMMAF